jgi:hypothetical protein
MRLMGKGFPTRAWMDFFPEIKGGKGHANDIFASGWLACGKGGCQKRPWNLSLLPAQSQAPESQAVPLQTDEEIHARCEALLGSEGRSGP